LLTDTALPVVDVAMASGFASLRRFNDLFRTRYRMTPGGLRRSAPSRADADRMSFDLAYRPPYDWPAMLAFLGRRAIAGVEAVDGRRYRRTVRLERGGKVHAGWIEIAPSTRKSALRVTASASLAGAVPVLLARVKSLLDIACRPDEIAAALGPLAEANPGLRLPGAVDGFEVAVRAILGQQVTVAAATTIAGRLQSIRRALRHAAPAERLFLPAPRRRVAPAKSPPGVISAREAIVAPARTRLDAALGASVPVEAAAALEGLPGVGPWTAQYIAMRALAWPDAFPHPDVAVLKAMNQPQPKRAIAIAEAWRPWRAYAVLHLWKSLNDQETHDPIARFDPGNRRRSPRRAHRPDFKAPATRPLAPECARPRARPCASAPQVADYFAGRRRLTCPSPRAARLPGTRLAGDREGALHTIPCRARAKPGAGIGSCRGAATGATLRPWCPATASSPRAARSPATRRLGAEGGARGRSRRSR
jgi:3-methyladenine DNA glycosylase/8-oxoguanine DNA glycosylase